MRLGGAEVLETKYFLQRAALHFDELVVREKAARVRVGRADDLGEAEYRAISELARLAAWGCSLEMLK